VRHKEDGYERMRPGHPGFEVHPDIAPAAGETVIDKTACDAFCGTDLDAILRESGVEHLVTSGMQTEMCVDSTTRSAVHRGFNVTLASDAHSTWDSDTLTAEQIIAHTNRTLAGIPGPGTGVTAKPSAEIEFARATS
jgi:nicotinamidase-related amidase